MKMNMTTKGAVRVVFAVCTAIAASVSLARAQNALQFTGVKATVENAILLYWASNTNEVYEIDYADQLNGNLDGTTAWLPLYADYPSHGTNTFIADAGNYDITPEIPHPRLSPVRFYRVMLAQANDAASNPNVSIISPTNGASYLVNTNETLVSSLANAILDSYVENSTGITNIVRIGISGWNSCFNDSLQLYNDPDLNGLQFNDRTCFIP